MTTPTTQEKLKSLAEAAKAWGNVNAARPHTEYGGAIGVVGAVDEDGNWFPVADVDCGQYGEDDESMKLAQFYAAANPDAVLALIAERDAAVKLPTEREALLLKELRYITGISTGQVKRVADAVLASNGSSAGRCTTHGCLNWME